MARRQWTSGEADRAEFREERRSLFRITVAPTIWALHFAASYAVAGLTCARLADDGPDVVLMRLVIGAGTLVALGLIVWLGWRSWQQWDASDEGRRLDDQPTSRDRHRFLGHAAFLLSIVSFIGVIYTVLPVLLIGSCL
ncbi:hypothetical protein BV394_10985 [Brevirhabdus pacifica]|uniref:Uncharacterized protein n=1 Tax=Brevirhabdus pacifica TaxID=1267768 RepID=A0A1U7DJL2_9RHOB|nr:hypothetical protein [Brevirhabdus pacifica]APX90184.1 hypothetical protein BV394_10985 [Brevirhabdus pacifica]OWU78756.1 hypothetical protein ATO5_08475 [Loktanella sp. 22II-4b]PJJ80613.1 hypothetical protein CLV77_2884 [Brevirhabdus pacifica]